VPKISGGFLQRAACQVSSVADWATERKLPMPPSNCFETGRRSQTQSSVRPFGAETANGCLGLDRRGTTAERREVELEKPEDFVSAPPERVRRAFALLTRTYHGCRQTGNNPRTRLFGGQLVNAFLYCVGLSETDPLPKRRKSF